MRQLSVKSKIRQAHANMMARCYIKSCKSFSAYGKKGVRVCKQWHDMETFRNYCLNHGWFEGCHIARKGDVGHYEPNNILFMTPEENRREAGVRRGRNIKCLETGIEFESVKDAARWIKATYNIEGKLKTISENIRCKGLYGSTSYGHKWEVVK